MTFLAENISFLKIYNFTILLTIARNMLVQHTTGFVDKTSKYFKAVAIKSI